MAYEALDHRAANLLVAGFVAHRAARLGIRAILIKGFSLELHHLRKDRVSADVDVLVEHCRAAEFVEMLKAEKWVERAAPFGATRMTSRSVTLVHAGWPNDLDVHPEFPGLSSPSAAFDRLWSSRVAVQLAGVSCWIPDKQSSIVLWALHSLRGGIREPRHRLELEQLVNQVLPGLTSGQREELASRILELGADGALREVPELAVLIGERVSPVDEGSWASWQRSLAQGRAVTPWLQVLREANVSERPHLVWQAVWPSARDLGLMDPSLVDTRIGRCKSRVARIRRLAQRWWATKGD